MVRTLLAALLLLGPARSLAQASTPLPSAPVSPALNDGPTGPPPGTTYTSLPIAPVVNNDIGTPKSVPNSNTNPNPDPRPETGNNVTNGLGFDFGSYGRVNLGSDLRGHEGYGDDVVSHGTRLELAPYIELNFYYTGKIGDDATRKWRVVLVPAFADGDLFHYTGDLSSHFVIRNAYAEVENLGVRGLTLWLGSRMYRGDDIYQLNWWPLDNLNTVGGGAIFTHQRTTIALQAGLNRLDSVYQYETLNTPPRGTGAPGSSTVLDRPRAVVSLKLTQGFWRPGTQRGAKAAIYGELHALPSGQYTDPTSRLSTELPRDWGWVAGAQVAGWLRPNVFVNAWFRSAGGLAAYGEINVPTSLSVDRTVTHALEFIGALSGNYESKYLGLMVASYVRRFRDASEGAFNPLSYTEGIVAVRPTVYLGKYFHLAAEASFQGRAIDGPDPFTGRVLKPKQFKLAVMPTVSPTGKGSFARPNIFVVYSVSKLNQDALDTLWDPTDFRHQNSVVHYLGGGVEWWFNSSYR